MSQPDDGAGLAHDQRHRVGRDARGTVLDDAAAAPIHLAAVLLLIKRRHGDADEPDNVPGHPLELADVERQLVPEDEPDAEEAEDQPHPLPRPHPLAQQRPHHRGDDDRLHADDERGDAGRNAAGDRRVDAAQIHRLQEQADSRDVTGEAPAARPRRPAGERDRCQQQGHDDEAVEQAGEGLGETDTELGDDEAAGPSCGSVPL